MVLRINEFIIASNYNVICVIGDLRYPVTLKKFNYKPGDSLRFVPVKNVSKYGILHTVNSNLKMKC